jgi:site-specific DNA recombinase
MQRRRNPRRSSKVAKYAGEENSLHYIRVSSEEQAIKALNLENQEGTCRDHCTQQGWPVVERFLDRHSARNAVDRPEFQRLLAYCRANRGKIRYVVVYDLSRFARNVGDQAVAIAELERCGVRLRSVREPNIDESPAGRLAANILGGMNQYMTDSLVINMRDKCRKSAGKGRFPWRAPLGYKNVGGNTGPNIIPNESAPLIRRAFELIRTDRYKQADVLEVINKEGLTTGKGEPVPIQTFQAILRNPLYAGWVTMPSDDTFEPVRGLHEPIISQELFDEVQSILEGRKPTPTPKRKVNPDFPLKCFVRCESCGNPLTGGFCKGKTKTYRRYWCYRPLCRAVALLADELEEQFVHLLGRLRPSPGDDSNISKKAVKRWADRQGDVVKETRRLQASLESLRGDKRTILRLLMDKKISDTTYTESEAEYSDSIQSAEQELRNLQSRGGEQDAFLRFVDEFRSVDMAAVWQKAAPEHKKRVQTFLFSGGLTYSEKTESLNPSKASLFSCLEVFCGPESSLASPTGFEPVLSP